MKSTSDRDKQIVKIVKMRGNREKMDRRSAKVTYFFSKSQGERVKICQKKTGLLLFFPLDVMSWSKSVRLPKETQSSLIKVDDSCCRYSGLQLGLKCILQHPKTRSSILDVCLCTDRLRSWSLSVGTVCLWDCRLALLPDY